MSVAQIAAVTRKGTQAGRENLELEMEVQRYLESDVEERSLDMEEEVGEEEDEEGEMSNESSVLDAHVVKAIF